MAVNPVRRAEDVDGEAAGSVTGGGGWQGDGLAHEAFLFDSDEAMAERCLPFVRDGFERGEPVLVVAGAGVRTVLADALGPERRRLAMLGAAETWWRGSGAATLRAYHRDLSELARRGRPWRLVAEPVWLEHDAGRQWSRFEAVANQCYADYPYYSLCLHDRRRLPQDVLDHVLRRTPRSGTGRGPCPRSNTRSPGSTCGPSSPTGRHARARRGACSS